MIRKINIAIVVIFLVMTLFKLVQPNGDGNGEGVSETERTEIAAEGSELEVNFYYITTPPFCSVDPISRHNGFIIDQLKAIFPKVNLVCCDACTNGVQDIVAFLRKDPRGITCSIGEDHVYSEFGVSKTPVSWFVLRIMTLRDNPWKFTATNSFEGVELLVPEWVDDVPFARDLIKSGKARVVNGDFDIFDYLSEPGTCRAYLEPGSSNLDYNAASWFSQSFERTRRTKPVAKAELFIRVSNLDPQYAAKLIEEYETGYKRIKESGQRRRICEYYDFSD